MVAETDIEKIITTVLSENMVQGARVKADFSEEGKLYSERTYEQDGVTVVEKTTFAPDGSKGVIVTDAKGQHIYFYHKNCDYPYKSISDEVTLDLSDPFHDKEIKKHIITVYDEKTGLALRAFTVNNEDKSAFAVSDFQNGVLSGKTTYRGLVEKGKTAFLESSGYDNFEISAFESFYPNGKVALAEEYQGGFLSQQVKYDESFNIQEYVSYYAHSNQIKDRRIYGQENIRIERYSFNADVQEISIIDKIKKEVLSSSRKTPDEEIVKTYKDGNLRHEFLYKNGKLVQALTYRVDTKVAVLQEKIVYDDNDNEEKTVYALDGSYTVYTQQGGLFYERHYFVDGDLDYEQTSDENRVLKIVYMNQEGIDHSVEYLSDNSSFVATYSNNMLRSFKFEATNGITNTRDVPFYNEFGQLKRIVSYANDGSRSIQTFAIEEGKSRGVLLSVVVENASHQPVHATIYKEGKKESVLLYNPDRSYEKISFSESGEKKEHLFYTANNFLVERRVFAESGKMQSLERFDSQSGFLQEKTQFDEQENPLLYSQFDANERLIFTREYREIDDVVFKFERNYFPDALIKNEIFIDEKKLTLSNKIVEHNKYFDEEKPAELITYGDNEQEKMRHIYQADPYQVVQRSVSYPNGSLECMQILKEKKTGCYIIFSSLGKKMEEREIGPQGLSQVTYYAPDGVTKRRVISYDNDGSILQEDVYSRQNILLDSYNYAELHIKTRQHPNSDVVAEKGFYTSGNKLVFKEIYNEAGFLTAKETYSSSGKLQQLNKYDGTKDQKLLTSTEYSATGQFMWQKNYPASSKEVPSLYEELFEGGFKETLFYKSEHKMVKSETLYRSDKTLESVKKYTNEGFLESVSSFDKKGVIKSMVLYDKDGVTPKIRVNYDEKGLPKQKLVLRRKKGCRLLKGRESR